MALSFCYSPAASSQYRPYSYNKDEIKNTCQEISTTTSCLINFNEPNITLVGNDFMLARGDLLQRCPLKVQLTVTVPYTLSSKQVEQLERETDTLVKLQQQQMITTTKEKHSSFITDTLEHVLIIGTPQQVEQCRLRLLVLIDEMKSLTVEAIELPMEIQYLICGRKRAGLLPIIEETSTNIYFPSPFDTPDTINLTNNTITASNTNSTATNTTTTNNTTTTSNSNNTDIINNKNNIVYITGEHVTRVTDMLNKLSIQKQKSMYHKDTALYARKIDWLLLHRRDELRKIMHDNGSFILFPKIGSGDNRVTVYAENRVNAERTLRALNFQACTIYEACFYFNNSSSSSNDGVGESSSSSSFFDSSINISGLVTQLSQVSGSEVIYNNHCIEVLGTERAIRNVYQRLSEMQFLQVFHRYTLFRVESSNEQRDFISGKKNGKINKIMKTSGAKIRFLSIVNDYDFLIEVESASFTKALDGLTLLQEELPAEISFYVPESYHKRIIGVGGKNIQRIMKKYGVYVKFSNTEEFAALGGYYNNQDNVVARTPMKNQINLDNLRHAVMELIHPKDRNYITQSINIPNMLHRNIIHHFQSFITDVILKKTNTTVLWPDAELASDTVELMGPEAHIPIAIEMLQTIIPEDYLVHVPKSNTLDELVLSDLFKQNVMIKVQELGIQLNYSGKKKEDGKMDDNEKIKQSEGINKRNDKGEVGEGEKGEKEEKEEKEKEKEEKEDRSFLFSMTRDKITEALPKALLILIKYLEKNNIPLYEDTKTIKLPSSSRTTITTATSEATATTTVANDLIQSLPISHPTLVSPSVLDQLRSINDQPIYNTKPSYPFFIPSSSVTSERPTNTIPDWKIPRPPKKIASQDDNLRAIFDAPISEQERIRYSHHQRMSMPPPSSSRNNFGFPHSGSGTPTGGNNNNDIWATTSNDLASSKRRSAGFPSSSSGGGGSGGGNGMSTSNENNIHHQMMFDQSGFYPRMSGVSKEFNPYSDLKPSLSDPIATTNIDHNFKPSSRSNFNKTEGFQASVLYQPPVNFNPSVNVHPGTQFFAKSEQVNVQDILDTLSSTTSSAGSTGFDPRRPPADQENKGSRPPPGIDM